jgi:hypothetical protein
MRFSGFVAGLGSRPVAELFPCEESTFSGTKILALFRYVNALAHVAERPERLEGFLVRNSLFLLFETLPVGWFRFRL